MGVYTFLCAHICLVTSLYLPSILLFSFYTGDQLATLFIFDSSHYFGDLSFEN